MIEKDHLGDWSPEEDCCLRLRFLQPVPKPSSESNDSLSRLKIEKTLVSDLIDWSIGYSIYWFKWEMSPGEGLYELFITFTGYCS